MEWVEVKKLARDTAAYREFKTLLKNYSEHPEKQGNTYAYCIHSGLYEYMNGDTHYYTHKSERL